MKKQRKQLPLLILILFFYAVCEADTDETCSRDSSRKVREYLTKNVYPKLPMPPENLPLICALNPKLDIYKEQESYKKEVGRSDWKCLYCGKHFKSELYLDLHMHNKHSDKLSNSTTCLADLCPVFGCPRQGNQDNSRRNNPASRTYKPKKHFSMDKCTEQEVEKSRHRCEVLTKRCFGNLDATLQSHFYNSICQKLHCQDGILQGILWTPEQEQRGAFTFWLLRLLLVVLIIGFLLAYIMFVGVSFLPRRDLKTAPSSISVHSLLSQMVSSKRKKKM